MDLNEAFRRRVANNVEAIGRDREFLDLSTLWNREAIRFEYAHNFTWLGRPIIQVPQDTYAIQELIWRVKPDLVVETGIAHGGSLIMSASMLALIDYAEAMQAGVSLDPAASHRKVVGVDIDIRAHNRAAIEAHPLSAKLRLIEGSSVDPSVVQAVYAHAAQAQRVMVFLDSNHTHDHVLAELRAYAPLVARDSYIVVWDTGVEDLPEGFCKDRPWDKGDNPKTAVWAFLKELAAAEHFGVDGERLRFDTDKHLEYKLAVTAAPDGFLRRI